MDIKTRTSLLLIFLFQFSHGQIDNPTHSGVISFFLEGNPDKAFKLFSDAILRDSTAYENYYLRGVTRMYLNDTANCLSDLSKSIYLKQKFKRTITDTLTNAALFTKPPFKKNFCQNDITAFLPRCFFHLWVGTCLILSDGKKQEICEALDTAEKEGLRQVNAIRPKHCK
jgi:hypothetical protein